MTQTTEGTGHGAVDRVKSKIINGDVRDSNLELVTVLNNNSDFENVQLIKAPDGSESDLDGKELVIQGGAGYLNAAEEDDADGGNVVISGGMQHGDGNSGDVIINGGDSSTGFSNSDAGNVILRGGDGLGPADSDGGTVFIRGGDCEAVGTTGEAGNIDIRGGNSTGSSGGNVNITGGNSGSTEEDGDNDGGDVNIFGGQGGGNTARGGDITIQAGSGTASHGVTYINGLLRLPVFASINDVDNLIATGGEENGMICYITDLNAFVGRVNGAWVTLNTSIFP